MVARSNRTFMELKYKEESAEYYSDSGSNRTFMELKLSIAVIKSSPG